MTGAHHVGTAETIARIAEHLAGAQSVMRSLGVRFERKSRPA